MEKRFDLMTTNLKDMKDGIDHRLDKIEKDIEPLIDYKAKSEGSLYAMKWMIGFGIVVIPIIISLIQLYVNKK